MGRGRGGMGYGKGGEEIRDWEEGEGRWMGRSEKKGMRGAYQRNGLRGERMQGEGRGRRRGF